VPPYPTFTTPPPLKFNSAAAATLWVVSEQQNELFYIIHEASSFLNETKKHVNLLMHTANKTSQMVEDLKLRADKLNSTVMLNDETEKILHGAFTGTMHKANETFAQIFSSNSTSGKALKYIAKWKKIHSAVARADDGLSALQVLEPRMESLDRKVANINSELHGGNVSLIVDEAVDRTLMDVSEDTSRGFAAALHNFGEEVSAKARK